MGKYSTRKSKDDVTIFSRDGALMAGFGKARTELTAPNVQLGPQDAGNIQSGNNQMNPVGQEVPSTVVSPQSTWVQTFKQYSFAINVIMILAEVVDEIEDSFEYDSSPYGLGRPIRRQSYQVVDFNEFLPEDLTSG